MCLCVSLCHCLLVTFKDKGLNVTLFDPHIFCATLLAISMHTCGSISVTYMNRWPQCSLNSCQSVFTELVQLLQNERFILFGLFKVPVFSKALFVFLFFSVFYFIKLYFLLFWQQIFISKCYTGPRFSVSYCGFDFLMKTVLYLSNYWRIIAVNVKLVIILTIDSCVQLLFGTQRSICIFGICCYFLKWKENTRKYN